MSTSLVLGATAVKWMARVWLQDDTLTDAAEDLGGLVGRHLEGRDARKTTRALEELADNIADRLDPFIVNEFRSTASNERLAAALAANTTLAIGLGKVDPVALNVDAASIEAAVLSSDPDRALTELLSDGGTALYQLLVTECCNYIASTCLELPAFTAVAAKELLSRTTALSDLATKVLDRLPPTLPDSWGTGSADQIFAGRYLKGVVQRNDKLQIFGLRRDAYRVSYSLSVAYISLTATAPRAESTRRPKMATDEFDAFDDISDDGHTKSAHGASDEQDGDAMRVESALLGNPRIILSGGAGSGKTTLLQWLAVTASQSGFQDELAEWNGCVPFLLPLRRFANGELPPPETFVGINHPSLDGVMPLGWVHRMLATGRAIVLIDGLDELPESQRPVARAWLADLIDTFPEARFVVTSRPLAVSADWEELSGFKRSELLPMQRTDIRAFIAHWHAAAHNDAEAPEDSALLDQAEQHLISAVNVMPNIRALCTSPLLCALICAMHRQNVGRLPKNRLELYETALEMLTSSRDDAREIFAEGVPSLSYEEKRAILSDFAGWLHENGASDAEMSTFSKRVAQKARQLPGHPNLNGDAVGQILLTRSGVLRIPVDGRVDFVHRTFLEYLAAIHLVDEDSVGKIVNNAHLDQWREVTILAAGRFPMQRREQLLRELVERGQQENPHRHRLFLLAVASLETSATLSPELQELINTCLDEVLPPTNMTDAAGIASAGNLAVSRLATPGARANIAAACVRALSLIGTDEAMAQLRAYRHDTRVTVSRQLLRAWGQFDTEMFAAQVLADSPLDRGHVILTDPEQQQHMHYLKKANSAFLDFTGKVKNLADLQPSDVVTGVNFSRARTITDLNGIGRFPNLRRLWMENASLRSLVGIEDCPDLEVLDVENNPNLADIGSLARLSKLKTLYMVNTPVSRLDFLDRTAVEHLRIGGSELREIGSGEQHEISNLFLSLSENLEDLEQLCSWESLRRLTLYHDSGAPIILPRNLHSLRISTYFGGATNLTGGEDILDVDIWGVDSRPVQLPDWPKLRNLRLDRLTWECLPDKETLQEKFPALSDIVLTGNNVHEIKIPGFERIRVTGRPGYVATFQRIPKA